MNENEIFIVILYLHLLHIGNVWICQEYQHTRNAVTGLSLYPSISLVLAPSSRTLAMENYGF